MVSVDGALTIEVVWHADGAGLRHVRLQLAAGATVKEALRAGGVAHDGTPPLDVGIWGRACALDTVLRDHDRVECYRPLRVDPKEARRLRAGRSSKG